jgi:two-component system chemotaxis sensor kinase CheA
MQSDPFDELKSLGDKIATELVFAEPGRDNGLLPVNSLLSRIEELAGRDASAGPLARAATVARGWVNAIFDSTGLFSPLDIKRLGEWVEWWQAAVSACQYEKTPPPIPGGWQLAEDVQAQPGSSPAGMEEPLLMPDLELVASSLRLDSCMEEPLLIPDLEQDGELLKEFINESREHLQNIEQGALALEQHPADTRALDSIFRAFHTFKGGSGFLNLTPIQTLAHELESLLDLARRRKLAVTPPVINLILEGGDTLRQFCNEIAAQLAGDKPPGAITVPTNRLLQRVRSMPAGEPASIHSTIPSVAAPAQAAGAPAPVIPAAGLETSDMAGENPAGTVVKVNTAKLDSLMDLVGEMLIAQSLVAQNPELNPLQNEQLARDLARLGRISKDLQHTAMSLRMVSVRATFQKMRRLVRDLSMKVGKQIDLRTEGEDTELDRAIVEEISDPIAHMIRNSIDHGIEQPEVRVRRGKPAQGAITLKAFHQCGNIVIQIKDDGNGLDRKRILATAIERGRVKPDEQPSDHDLFKLILDAGFSTAEKVTDLSGRGVGLDVVRRNIARLRGKIEIESKPGEGSAFSISLPLTLAIIDGLLVEVGRHRFIVPALLARESFRPAADMIHTLCERGEVINLRGKLLPLVRLHARLGIEPATTNAAESIAVVVETGNDIRCLLVDKLLGKHEVVIKSLGETFRRNKCLAGAAILGDGRIGLILDPRALARNQPAPLEAAA